MIVRVGIDLGEPDHFLGIDSLSVDDGGNLPVGAACVKADAAAAEMAADFLGGVLALGHLVHQQHLKGMLKDVCHVVPVEFLLAAGAVDAAKVIINHLIAADIDAEAALHPEDELHQPVDVEAVGLLHLRGAVDEGVIAGHLSLCPLHRNGDRLFRGGQKGLVKKMQGDKPGVQLRAVFHVDVYTEKFHIRPTSFVNFGYSCIVT